MQNLLLLLYVAGHPSLSAYPANAAARIEPATPAPTIVARQPRGEPGDFVLCKDGRVLVFPAAHPQTCS
ncbi:hypothetical protein BTH42_31805 [Burkholderia sp. SRS-W-2-2016]|uniref:hypothetical protein n=1 Tax=Burkholderia sp. SRS-W-2-2016 TaxID=1926878 RepID=UPI00094B2E1D|nr:hypothetical protein [Burkholderia sp. SRS-W-2-2016]OLL27620.1 hypothetical protein BTH42_31805 [Burkholderia sp. SRS-W-2-2016]